MRLPLAHRLLAVETVLALGVARLALLTLSWSRLSAHLGRPMAESPDQPLGCAEEQLVRDMANLIRRASGRVPWRCLCFEQALAARMMLKRRRIGSTLYLGVARRREQLDAHAWLRSGDRILTGIGGIHEFVVVATFADVVR